MPKGGITHFVWRSVASEGALIIGQTKVLTETSLFMQHDLTFLDSSQ